MSHGEPAPPADSSPLRVLLVEDDADLAEATAEFLKLEGLDVQVAVSGGDALEAASAFHPQLVLCDLNLPDMNGLDVVRGLRANPSTQKTYVVILTAMRAPAEQPGVDAFIAKPITIDAVQELVEKLAPRQD
jgi:CheY-like chemotaxis protein